ncbi:MAG: hypothetical protein IPJ82_03335 [Lewinellaceae bacterium]|nr:hypothetical protein [Lewinellaceae bacterium]
MRNLILLLMLAVPGIVFAQEAASDKAIADACKCFDGLSQKKLSDAEKKGPAMECLTQAMLTHIEDLAAEYGYETSELNEETGRKIGERFGMKLVQKCPASVPFMMALGQEEIEKGNVSVARYESEGETTGAFVRLETSGEIVKLVVKGSEGEETLRWLRPFPGEESLEKQGKTLAGKKVTVQWGEYKQYVHSMKGYAKYREILSFKLAD